MSEVSTIAKEEISKEREKEILTQAISDPRSAIRALVLGDLYYFMQYFWSEYSPKAFVPNWHVEEICKELQVMAIRVGNGEPKLYDLIINVPPGTTKTATVSIFFPLWCWARWYWMRFITASYTHTLSLESAEYSREIVRSVKWKAIFPEIEVKEDKDTKSNFRVVKKEWVHRGYAPRVLHGGNRFSTSVNGTVTGFHADIKIIDDPIDPNGVASELELRKTNRWCDTTLPSRSVNKTTSITIIVMQRLHQEDPTGHLLKVWKKVKHICLPGEIKNFAKNVSPPELIKKYSKDGLLDSNRLTWDNLNEFATFGQYTYSSQIGQDPVPLGGGMFKTDNIKVVTQAPEAHQILRVVRYWDKAGTEGGDGAFSVGVKIALMKDKTFLVLDVKRGRWGTDKRERLIKEHAQSDGRKCYIGIEQEPGSGGKESAESTLKNLAGYMAFKDRPTGDKAFRADPFSVQVNLGNVSILHGEWNKEYIEELKNFPNSTYKDQTDASSGGFAFLTRKKKAGAGRDDDRKRNR